MHCMNEELIRNANTCYRQAEQKAADYFRSLQAQVMQKMYVTTLTKDIESWKHNHIHHSFLSIFSLGKGKPAPKEYHNYIKWLDYSGKLDNYLDRSISYIFMRDLGKSLASPDTLTRVQRV